MLSDPYSLLGVSKDATDRDIRLAFLKLVRILHPDKNIHQEVKYIDKNSANLDITKNSRNTENSNITIQYHALYDAYCLLKDPQKRKNYDIECEKEKFSPSSWHYNIKYNQLKYLQDNSRVLYYDCRCGDTIFIEKKDLEAGFNLFPCDTCSIVILISLY
ncbi:DnaJ domain-containing protein [Cryptosporidium serpentis]